MKKTKKRRKITLSVAESVRNQIEAGGERIWRLADFVGLSFSAVAKTLSRLSQQGIIQRLGKGLYYRARQTRFGESKPNPSQIRALINQKEGVFPAGNSAANLLGFTTQNAAKIELSTTKLSLPRLIIGKDTVIHTRRPESWDELSDTDAALLDFLRRRGKDSELSTEETVSKLLQHFRRKGQFERLIQVIESEPPRVRAILGAIGQQIGGQKGVLCFLQKSLNPLSKFDFGNLIALKYAKKWQAKDSKPYEII